MKTALKTGTREWSEHSVNIGMGCSNGCIYCYAREMALRFKKIASPADFEKERFLKKSAVINEPKKDGVIMFPTQHDITPFYEDAAIEKIKAMLAAGNEVLVVTKPRLMVITRLLMECNDYKSQLELRFTIGTLSDKVRQIWEPGATSPDERLTVLQYAYYEGFETSVSAEPLLPMDENGSASMSEAAKYLYIKMKPYITRDIWFGLANKLKHRVKTKDEGVLYAVDELVKWQNKSNVIEMVKVMQHEPKVKFKDSIQKILKEEGHEQ